jgi:hypothetical protein
MAAFEAPDGDLVIAPLTFGVKPAPPRVAAHAGDTVTVQYER